MAVEICKHGTMLLPTFSQERHPDGTPIVLRSEIDLCDGCLKDKMESVLVATIGAIGLSELKRLRRECCTEEK